MGRCARRGPRRDSGSDDGTALERLTLLAVALDAGAAALPLSWALGPGRGGPVRTVGADRALMLPPGAGEQRPGRRPPPRPGRTSPSHCVTNHPRARVCFAAAT